MEIFGVAAAFEERVAAGVEEVAAAGGADRTWVRGCPAVIYKVEEREELRPRSRALVHGVGVASGVGAEALEESADTVVVGVDGVGGKQVRGLRRRG